jgi:hypothetical protein
MKKALSVTVMVLFTLVTISAAFAEVENGKISLKVGDEVYVCNCGVKCPCETMSRKEGKCSCGADLVKGTVTKVEKGKAMVMVDGKERSFKTTGKYTCACGGGCPCDTISQKPGKCACGKDLQAVKATKK